MTNNQNSTKYNLEERTAKFGEYIIIFCKELSVNHISKPLITQLVRSATSVGANYMEANGASSKTDFKNKIYICRKEIQETKHWLRLLKTVFPKKKNDLDNLWNEAQELTLIFSKISGTLKRGNKN